MVFDVSARTRCPEGGTVFDGSSGTLGPLSIVPGFPANARTELYFDQCGVVGLELNGLTSEEFGDFEELDEFNDESARDINTIYSFQNFEVEDGNDVVTLESERLVSRREVRDNVDFDVITADFLLEGTFQTYTVTDSTGSFALRDVDISQSRFSGNDATTSTFVVETLNGQTINAQGAITDVFRSSPDGEFLQSGVLVVTSGNSTLTIEANDQSTYLVTLERGGSVITELLPWSGTELPVPALALL